MKLPLICLVKVVPCEVQGLKLDFFSQSKMRKWCYLDLFYDFKSSLINLLFFFFLLDQLSPVILTIYFITCIKHIYISK